MVSVDEAEIIYPPMNFVSKAKIKDYWYCASCRMYRKNDGFKDPPPCPECSSNYYNYNNRDPIFNVDLEGYLQTALREAEKESPDLEKIRRYLRACYGFYEHFAAEDYGSDDFQWIDKTLGV